LLPVVIDPGRAFGTGSHPTTQLCLELLQELERGSLVDLGCGSGVIAIAAARLGYAPVHAVDLDEVAVEATSRNIAVNGVDVEPRLLDLLHEKAPAADVAVANIDLRTISALRPRAGWLVTSGYPVAERPEVSAFDHVERRTRDGWAADLFRRE
jgi:ribosomal protein L11 methyltransferase